MFHKRKIQELQRESEGIQGKLDKLMDLLLDGAVSKQEHDLKRQKFKARQIELANQLNSYPMADNGFRDAVADTLELGRKAHDLFLRSNNAGKCQLLGFVFSNLQLNGQKVQYSLHKPFDLYVKAGNIGQWRAPEDKIDNIYFIELSI